MNRFLTVLIILFFVSNACFADNSQKALSLVQKAKTAKFDEAKYEYLHLAEKLYLEDCEQNPSDIKTLVNLSKVYQMLEQRSDAKMYIMRAYNIHPENADIQKQMGDFYYNFGEYSTAIQFYNLSLANGNLKDYETNLQTAKCYEKLGDKERYEIYYEVCLHLNPKAKDVINKINAINSEKIEDNKAKNIQNSDKKFKYLFKDKILSDEEQSNEDADEIINSLYN